MNKAYLLEDVCELIVDCEHKTAPTQETGYPSIRTPNIGRGSLILDKVKRVSEETYKKWTRRAIPTTDDLILAREAPVGNVAIIPSNLKVCLGQRTVLIRANKNKVFPRYLCYLLLGDEIQGKFFSLSNGATVHHLNVKDIRNLELPKLPPLPTQKKIASILSTYDDLIENNTKRIKILEEMAQTIYKEWFVKFRFPGHEQVKMVESELGLIPEGWEVKKLGRIASFKTGKLNSNAAKPDGIYPFFTCSQQIFRTDTYSFDTECIVLAGNNANGIFHIKYFNGKFDVYQRTYVIQTLDKQTASNYYLYFAIKEQLELLKSISTGAATKFLTIKILNNINIIVNSNQIQEQFSDVISTVFSQIDILQEKNQNLRKTRDLLLPKLI
ncbi:restriction endonuclease subunit S, partial [Crocosphaera chwakensis]